MATSSASPALDAAGSDGRSDFDFLHGRWTVRHRRLHKRLEGDTKWDEFGGTTEVCPTLGGLGNMDDNIIELPGGAYRAMTVRAFDPATKLWSIWWLDGRYPATIDVPVRGAFKDGIGVFLCDDVFNGRPIKVRFTWSRISKTSARWDQAFSPDGGASWEDNWTMEFTRV